MRVPRRIPSLIAFLPLVAALLGVPAFGPQATRAGATSIQVTTTEDELTVDGECSLREAVIAANTNLAVDACQAGNPGHDGIWLQPDAVYTLAIPGRGEDLAATGDLDVTESLNVGLEVPGQTATIDGGDIDRIFDVADEVDNWTFRFLTLRNGDAGAGEGGAVRVGRGCTSPPDDHVNGALQGLVIEDNHAAIGGGIHLGTCQNPFFQANSIIGNTADETGGGVSVVGTTLLRVESSTFSGNSAGAAGGGIWADLDDGFLAVIFTTIARNTAPDGAGLWVGGEDWPIINAAIIAENTGPSCRSGVPLGGSGWIGDDGTCFFVDIADAGLEPLVQVGRNFVHPLSPDSPAIDFDQGTECASGLLGDLAGNSRPLDGNGDGVAWCDAGSFEAAAIPFIPPSSTPPPPPAQLPDTAMRSGGGDPYSSSRRNGEH